MKNLNTTSLELWLWPEILTKDGKKWHSSLVECGCSLVHLLPSFLADNDFQSSSRRKQRWMLSYCEFSNLRRSYHRVLAHSHSNKIPRYTVAFPTNTQTLLPWQRCKQRSIKGHWDKIVNFIPLNSGGASQTKNFGIQDLYT